MEFVKAMQIKKRMCKRMSCDDCPINNIDEAEGRYTCATTMCSFPAEIEKILIEWDKANPVKTFLSDFLEKHPKAELINDGSPLVCPCELGYTTDKDCYFNTDPNCADCLACWSRPLENEGTE